MNQKEIAFCRLRAEGKTLSQAAQEAGYTDVYAETLSKKKYIQNEIAKLSEQKKKKDIDADILQFLTSVMNGDAYIEKNDSIMKDRMKAAELLGKRQEVMEQTESDVVMIVDDINKKKV